MKVIDKIDGGMNAEELFKIAQEEGVTVREVLKVMNQGMKSNLMWNHTGGIEETDRPDNANRHKYMMAAIDVLRMIDKKQVMVGKVEHEHHLSKEDMDSIKAIFAKTAELRDRRNRDKIQQGAEDAVIRVI